MTNSREGDYAQLIERSERVGWCAADVLPSNAELCFERLFLPDSLVAAHRYAFLSEGERRSLNHIVGHAYLNLFAFVEESQ